MIFRSLRSVTRQLRQLRGRLGSKWCLIALLIPPAVFGVWQFGPRAALVLAVSIIGCMVAGALPRLLAGESYQLLHPGSLITGLLLGLTLSATTPAYMIVVGVLVAQLPGKFRWKLWKRNPFNPAALGRTAVAVLEFIDPGVHTAWDKVDVVTGASALFKDAGGHLRPYLSDVFLGFTRGAIGETSDAILIPVGVLLLWLVVVKRDATLAMICAVPLLVLALPPGADVVGHAPWAMNPVMYLFSSNTLLLAFFFASDPVTTPHTRMGGLLFGIGVAAIGVCGRLYTTIPGAEMYGILAMNLAAPGLDRIGRAVSGLRSPTAASVEPVFKLPVLQPADATIAAKASDSAGQSAASRFGAASFYDALSDESYTESDIPETGVMPRLASVEADEPFATFRRILTEENREQVLETVRGSGLQGYGGAYFPVALKWDSVRSQPGPRVMIVNGQEGEPETFKDRYLMRNHPAVVIEGVAIAAWAVEASDVIIVVTSRCETGRLALSEALEQLRRTVGDAALPSIRIVTGPDLYVVGEETALIEFLESRRGEPQLRPPFPTERGLWGRPTLVQNVETVSWLPAIFRNGADWFLADGHGLKLVSLVGAVQRPGIYEVPLGIRLGDILNLGGGPPRGDEVQAFAVGGPSGAFIPASCSDAAFLQSELKTTGTILGTGAVRIVSTRECLLREALESVRFFRDESCGRCTPCRVGTVQMARIWLRIMKGDATQEDVRLIEELADVVRMTSICGLGVAAPARMLSILLHWPELVEQHLSTNGEDRCPICSTSG